MLPITVVFPSRNSASLLPAHLKDARTWLEIIPEFVVVDSASTDGTVSIFKESLPAARTRYLDHPPGLYQSWNAAVTQATSKFVYLSTIGDRITREGLQSLCEAAESSSCDVVISKPRVCSEDGRNERGCAFAVEHVLSTLRLTKPRKLERIEALVFAIGSRAMAMSGSVASDLFRTETLKRCPFPTEFGKSGDAAWGMLHCLDVSWGVVPGEFSTFLLHETQSVSGRENREQTPLRPDVLIRQALADAERNGAATLSAQELACASRMMGELETYVEAKIAFDKCRKQSPPWILRPTAWRWRSRRNGAWKRLWDLEQDFFRNRRQN